MPRRKSRRATLRAGRPVEPADWQELHSPTEPVRVRLGHGGREADTVTRRRVSDARFWGGLDGQQQDAMVQIDEALRATAGTTYAPASRFIREPKGTGNESPGERRLRLLDAWRDWSREGARRLGLHFAEPLIAYLIDPVTLGEIDRRRRWRNGTARGKIVAALDLWCEVRGWKRRGG